MRQGLTKDSFIVIIVHSVGLTGQWGPQWAATWRGRVVAKATIAIILLYSFILPVRRVRGSLSVIIFNALLGTLLCGSRCVKFGGLKLVFEQVDSCQL